MDSDYFGSLNIQTDPKYLKSTYRFQEIYILRPAYISIRGIVVVRYLLFT
jgi:hypothetical protein